MKSRNKIRAIFISIGAALWVALFAFNFFIRPFTAFSADVYILPPVVQWEVGWISTTGQFNAWDYDDNGVRTSPQVSVDPARTYLMKYTGVDFDNIVTTIAQYDSNGDFINRQQNNSVQFNYVPNPACHSVRVTVRTHYSNTVNFTMSYDDSQNLDLPTGTEQVYDEVHYGGDGDFYSVGNEKALTYYKYLPDENLKYIRVEAVNNYGKRLKFRVVGYVHGSEVFRSGLAEYGENIDIQDANFDYYNIYLVNLDEDEQSIPTEYIQSFRYIYGIKYYIYPPTDPPGISEEIYPTDYIDLNVNDWYIPTAPAADNTIDNALKMFNLIETRLFALFPFYTLAGAVAFAIWLVWHYNREE